MKMTVMPHLLMPSAAGGEKRRLLLLLCQGQGQRLHRVKACWIPQRSHNCKQKCNSFESHILCCHVSHAPAPISICLVFMMGVGAVSGRVQPHEDSALAEYYLVSLQSPMLFRSVTGLSFVQGPRRKQGQG